ncbi:hypothetical protein, partial [Diaphorobacter caeni]|uniref:hypothetical protein n=1 Tax=Diaphorobacter caeni TaxID=2784387 RepID=UPI001E396409
TDRITNQTTSTCRIRRFQPRQRSLVFYTEFCDPEEEIQDFFFLTTQSHHRITSNHLLVAKPSILYRFLNQPGKF